MGAEWPLIGRDEELSAITKAFRRRGDPRGAVLTGAAGVGKTRLAREVGRRAEAQGRRAHWIIATESSRQLPLGAFALAVGDVGDDPVRVLQRAAEALLSDAGDLKPVIVVDDAHLLDEVSASLVQQLVAHRGVIMILTVRSGAPVPDAVASLWKDRYLDRLDLHEFSLEQTSSLLAAALGGRVSPSICSQLHELSSGNALFLRQIVAAELASGQLQRNQGRWQWRGQLAGSTALTDLVRSRLDGASAEVGEVVDVLALGGVLDRHTVAGLLSPGALEDAESFGLVRVGDETSDDLVRLEHPLYGAVRLAGMGLVRARRLRGAIADALQTVPDPTDAVLLRRALLVVESDLPDDPELLTGGAQAALRRSDLSLARRLAEAAIDAGGEFEAQLTLSYALGFGLDPQAADEVLLRLAQSAGDDLQLRLRAFLPRAGHLYFEQGRTAEAQRLLDQARQEFTIDALQPFFDALGSVFLAMSGKARQALAMADNALTGDSLPPLMAVCAYWARVSACTALGRTDELGDAETRAHETAAASYESCMPRLGFAEQHLRALDHAGRIREAVELTRRLCPEVASTPILGPMLVCLESATALACGHPRTARETARRSTEELQGINSAGCLYIAYMLQAISSAMTDDAKSARAAAEAMDRERHPGYTVVEPDRMLAWAWVEAAEGATSIAIDRARAAAAWAADRDHWGSEAYALAVATRFGDRETADRLTELAALVDGPRVAAAAQQARGLFANDGQALIDASQEFKDMGDLLSAADAAAQAIACFTAQGDRTRAYAAIARANQLQRECEGARTPALVAGLEPLPLTVREREIVALAASGLTNREIAARLVVSVRTVEGHLYRAGTKLGNSNRRNHGTASTATSATSPISGAPQYPSQGGSPTPMRR